MSFDNQSGGTTTPLQLALAWGFVGIPLLWGIYGTLGNALKLFQERRLFTATSFDGPRIVTDRVS
jgi:hypothetical protein